MDGGGQITMSGMSLNAGGDSGLLPFDVLPSIMIITGQVERLHTDGARSQGLQKSGSCVQLPKFCDRIRIYQSTTLSPKLDETR